MSRRVSRAAARVHVHVALNQQPPKRVQLSINHSAVQPTERFFFCRERPRWLLLAISIHDDVVAVGGSLHFDMEHIVWVALETRPSASASRRYRWRCSPHITARTLYVLFRDYLVGVIVLQSAAVCAV